MASFPMPGEVHPAYADQPYLVDFAAGKMPDLRDHIVLPVLQRPSIAAFDDPAPTTLSFKQRIMTRREIAAVAPYVGRPYAYSWFAAVDELGRWVAEPEARIRYLSPDFWYDDPYAVPERVA
jgi:hypothetical protein